ncbi:hypothetical protein CFC21_030311 [Triticum aestivum]|uniref:Embryo surrounding factor 1 brassicaceae domain-containing protein n=3 Tax=Triticinae TaxID=1648030 RepID=A0A9R1JH15_WHEAT|nr:uncharacterized protein LOC120964132 [Aegilops tauschii subsp. strangulata]KAF7016779.1 hypothetical protein CFC21_030311 [Triticum aestivum]
MTKSRFAYVMAILFIGWVAGTAECRLEAGSKADLDYHTKTSTAGDINESKLNVKFCLRKKCGSPDSPFGVDCYCCLNKPDAPCFATSDDCQKKCPTCNPSCALSDVKEFHL